MFRRHVGELLRDRTAVGLGCFAGAVHHTISRGERVERRGVERVDVRDVLEVGRFPKKAVSVKAGEMFSPKRSRAAWRALANWKRKKDVSSGVALVAHGRGSRPHDARLSAALG